MTSSFFFILVGLLVLGVLLIILGRRGRRLNDHPQCRWCEFDLHGVYPQSVTCPECGAGLKRDKAVRMGVRKRMPLFTVLGVLLVLLPLAPLGLFVYAGATGTNLAKHTPFGILLWQGRHAHPNNSKQIAAELFDRALTKKLDKEQSARVIEVVKEAQADPAFPWTDEWGDLIERFALDGSLTPADKTTLMNGAVELEIECRGRVAAGDNLPVVIKAKPTRYAPGLDLMAPMWATTWMLGDTKLRAPSNPSPFSLLANGPYQGQDGTMGMLQLLGARSKQGGRWAGYEGMTAANFYRRVPMDCKPGIYPLDIEVAVRPSDMNNNMYGGNYGRAPKDDDKTVKRIKLHAQVRVVSQEEGAVELIPPTADMDAKLQKALNPKAVTITVWEEPASMIPSLFGGVAASKAKSTIYAQVTYPDSADLPVPVACDVVVKIGDKSNTLSPFISGKGNTARGYAGIELGGNFNLATVPAEGATCEVTFKPNPKHARNTVGLTQIYGGPVTIKNVPITINDQRTNRRTPVEKVKGDEGDEEPAKP